MDLSKNKTKTKKKTKKKNRKQRNNIIPSIVPSHTFSTLPKPNTINVLQAIRPRTTQPCHNEQKFINEWSTVVFCFKKNPGL